MALFVLFLILLLQSQTSFSLCYFINSLDLSFLNFFYLEKGGIEKWFSQALDLSIDASY